MGTCITTISCKDLLKTATGAYAEILIFLINCRAPNNTFLMRVIYIKIRSTIYTYNQIHTYTFSSFNRRISFYVALMQTKFWKICPHNVSSERLLAAGYWFTPQNGVYRVDLIIMLLPLQATSLCLCEAHIKTWQLPTYLQNFSYSKRLLYTRLFGSIASCAVFIVLLSEQLC
jgi:hypothetical protein